MKECKDVYRNLIRQRLQIDFSMSLVNTLTFKEGLPPYPFIFPWTNSVQNLHMLNVKKFEAGFLPVFP